MVEDKNLENVIEESYPNDADLWPSEVSESSRKYWLHAEVYNVSIRTLILKHLQ